MQVVRNIRSTVKAKLSWMNSASALYLSNTRNNPKFWFTLWLQSCKLERPFDKNRLLHSTFKLNPASYTSFSLITTFVGSYNSKGMAIECTKSRILFQNWDVDLPGVACCIGSRMRLQLNLSICGAVNSCSAYFQLCNKMFSLHWRRSNCIVSLRPAHEGDVAWWNASNPKAQNCTNSPRNITLLKQPGICNRYIFAIYVTDI